MSLFCAPNCPITPTAPPCSRRSPICRGRCSSTAAPRPRRSRVTTSSPPSRTCTLVTRGNLTEVRGEDIELSRDDPLALLRAPSRLDAAAGCELPFAGGAIGYFGYDLGAPLRAIAGCARSEAKTCRKWPSASTTGRWWSIISNAAAGWSGRGAIRRPTGKWDALVAQFSAPRRGARSACRSASPRRLASNLHARSVTAQAFRRVIDYIHAGDCYQINLAQRFSAQASGDPWLAYQALRHRSIRRRIRPICSTPYAHDAVGVAGAFSAGARRRRSKPSRSRARGRAPAIRGWMPSASPNCRRAPRIAPRTS